MLRHIPIDTKPNGAKIIIPVEVNEANFEQQVKIWLEFAVYNPFDAHLHISHFRHFHGGETVCRIIASIIQELQHQSIELDYVGSNKDQLHAFFASELERHQALKDSDFGYPPQ